jgi:uncharacterized membrane protein YtjA (UPF0391 family)
MRQLWVHWRSDNLRKSFYWKEFDMLYYALMFLVVGVIAGALNLAGVAAVAVQISWILFLIGIVLLAIHLFTNRSVRVPWSAGFSWTGVEHNQPHR